MRATTWAECFFVDLTGSMDETIFSTGAYVMICGDKIALLIEEKVTLPLP